MTTPVVEQIRNIPLIVDREYSCDPMAGGNESDDEESGFPFDRDFDRNRDGFRSQLDDIAQRHPEFAEHLGGFPFRQTRTHRTEEPEFRRFTDRPFGSRFDRYFQPDSYDENPAAYQQYYEARPEYYPPQEEQVEKEQATEEKPPKAPERGRKVQQSNTVDLGQKQEPVNDRNQRSMSAPPSENRTGQRFVSSINIPMGGGGSATSASASSDPPQQPQPAPQSNANKPTERVIPIHVEGRDEPVIPKSTHSNFGQASQSYTQHPPQPERIFGQRPEQFSQFLRREPRQFNEWRRPQQGPSPDELLRQQQQQYQKEQEQRFKQQQAAPQQQAPPQAPQPQAPEPQPQPQPPQQPAPPTTPIDQIHAIQEDVSQLIHQVEQFGGKPRDKQYLYLDEMLTRNLIKLDNIDTQGLETIRSARKEAIKCIEKCISLLEAKAASNVQGQVSEPAQEPSKEPEQMEVAESQEEKPQEEIMEVTPKVKVEEKHEATPEVTEEKPASAEAPSQQAEEVKEEKKDKKKGKKKVADAEKK